MRIFSSIHLPINKKKIFPSVFIGMVFGATSLIYNFVCIITDVDNEMLSEAESVSEDDPIPDNRQLVVSYTYDPDKENTVSQKSVKNGEFKQQFLMTNN